MALSSRRQSLGWLVVDLSSSPLLFKMVADGRSSSIMRFGVGARCLLLRQHRACLIWAKRGRPSPWRAERVFDLLGPDWEPGMRRAKSLLSPGSGHTL